MKIFVGTSGWYYEWNKDKTLDWYLENSDLNAVELNASFYRFPFPNQVKSWTKKGKSLHWIIKVNRLITHQFKFSERSFNTWQKFFDLFSDMHKMIDYFLFQLPPKFTARSKNLIEKFLKKTKMTNKFALEPRNESWFNKDMIKWAKSLGITWVSIDAPEFTHEIFKTTSDIYVRIHGRTDWYHHNYSNRELKEIAQRAVGTKARRIYVFFNNNHNMLTNAQNMRKILEDKGGK